MDTTHTHTTLFYKYYRHLLCLLLIICSTTQHNTCYSQHNTTPNIEMQVKAAYIYNLTKFVYWDNTSKEKTITIYILGSDPIANILEAYINSQSDNNSIIVKKITSKTTDFSDCQILFIGESKQDEYKNILKQITTLKILTISDIPAFAEKGGMVGFELINNKLKIEINVNNATKVGLKFNAKLLDIVKIVN